MNLRRYNIYFHTHTISGIIICALLFVIFFAGSYSFFKKEISAWQSNTSYREHQHQPIVYTNLLDSLHQKHNLTGRDLSFYFQEHSFDGYVDVSASKDSTLVSKNTTVTPEKGRGRGRGRVGDGAYFKYNFIKGNSKTYAQSYDMGEFLYRLHFLAQLNQVPIRIGAPFGYLLAGVVSFLFLFALITGLLLHWDKIVSNFFVFRPWSKVKTVWTDAHTALGVIGFPYQLIYAITGIILIFNTAIIAPFSYLFYEGKSEKLYQELDYADAREYTYSYQALHKNINIDSYVNQVRKLWKDPFIKNVLVKNYGDTSMHVIIEGNANRKLSFAGTGRIIFKVANDEVIYHKSPLQKATYIDKMKSLIYRLHFGDFGGYWLKIVYFLLGIMGCVVIISGILVWLVARDKDNVPAYKRKFNFWLANIFLAACLSMFPITALTLIAVKVNAAAGQEFIYSFYFYGWLLLSAYYILRKNLKRTNRETILLGSIFSLLIPVVNGICTGNWVWQTYAAGATDILFFDLFSLTVGLIGFFSFLKIKSKEKLQA
jgi:uncharacterized iron-regulated membrane protein